MGLGGSSNHGSDSWSGRADRLWAGGRRVHASLIASTPGLQLVPVVTGNPDRQAQARREHPGVGVLGHADELWRAAGDHDLVVVATTNATHLPLGLAAIQAGLAVVVDKPLALTAAEGRRLVAAARERGVLLTVFHNRRWDGDLRTLRRLLDADALGPVHRFESRYDRWRPAPRPGAWRELKRPACGCSVRAASMSSTAWTSKEEALRAGRRPTEPGWGREPRERWGWLGVDGDLRQVETEPGRTSSSMPGWPRR